MAPKQSSRISGAVYLVAAQGVVLVLGYATHLWIGRILGPASYGIYGVVLSVQSIVGLLLTLGVPVAVSRFVSRDEASARSILREALQIQSVIALLVASATFLLSPLIALLLRDKALTGYLRFTALIIFAQAYYPIFVQYLSGMHIFSRQGLLTALYAVAKLLGALSLLYAFEVYGAFAGFAIGGIAAGIFGFLWTRSVGGNKPKALPYKAFLEFAGLYVLILIGLQILISVDLFMVKALLKDNEQAGYYNAAVTLSRISYMLLQALSFIILPSVSKLTKPGESHDVAARFIADTIRYLIGLIVPSVALAAATSRALLALFFSGSAYEPAAPVLSVLMVGLGCIAFYQLLMTIAAGAGKAKVVLVLTSVLVVLSIGMGFIFIPIWGLLGAAWQTTLVGLIGLIVLSFYTFSTFGISYPIRTTINVVLSAALAIVPTYFFHPTPLRLPFLYLAAAVLYIVGLLVLHEITPADKIRVANTHRLLEFVRPKPKRV